MRMANFEDERILDDNLFRVAPEGILVLAITIVSACEAVLAVLFKSLIAGQAVLATINHESDSRDVADFEFGDVIADSGDRADDLVTWNARPERIAPLVASLMDIRMADTAVKDVDLDVMLADNRSYDFERRKWRFGT
jgi:hypothetical protein